LGHRAAAGLQDEDRPSSPVNGGVRQPAAPVVHFTDA
jgi:hypothetical protein